MSYIRHIRSLIGHQPFILVGAAVLIFNQDGRLLLQRRTDNHAWGIPGGALEPGESLEEAARREAFEETGLDIGQMQLWQIFSGPELFYIYPNGDQVHNVSAVYITQETSGELNPSALETKDTQYFALDSLPEDISPPVRPVLKRLLENNPLEKNR